MIPSTPVVPGQNYEEVVIARNQPPYCPLPAIRGEDFWLTRWQLSKFERLKVLFTGSIYHWQMGFGPMQAIKLTTEKPRG